MEREKRRKQNDDKKVDAATSDSKGERTSIPLGTNSVQKLVKHVLMKSSCQCQNCDEGKTWLKQSLYTGKLTGRGQEIN